MIRKSQSEKESQDSSRLSNVELKLGGPRMSENFVINNDFREYAGLARVWNFASPKNAIQFTDNLGDDVRNDSDESNNIESSFEPSFRPSQIINPMVTSDRNRSPFNDYSLGTNIASSKSNMGNDIVESGDFAIHRESLNWTFGISKVNVIRISFTAETEAIQVLN